MTKILLLKTLLTIWILVLLAGCGNTNHYIPPDNVVSLAKVASFYDGSISAIEEADNSTKTASQYIRIDLHSPNLKQRYGTHLELPASVCAYAVWRQLSPNKQAQTKFFKVTLHSAGSKLTYTIPTADVVLVASSITSLATLISDLKTHNITPITNGFTRESLRGYPTDSLQRRLARIANKLAPLSYYDLEGFTMLDDTSALGRPPLVRFLVSIPHSPSQKPYLLSAGFISGTNKSAEVINDMQLTE